MTAMMPPVRLETLFHRLAEEWREATCFESSTTAIATHAAYQRIIGLGPAVVPLILADLQREPDHWFWALRAITGEDPVSASDLGSVQAMSRSWLLWGAETGWIS